MHLIEMLKTKYPIIQGPIGAMNSPELVAAISNAGGYGMLALGFSSNIDEIKNALNKPLCLIKNLIDKSHMARKPESFLKEFKELVSVARFPNGIWSELRYSVDILNHGFLSELNKEFPSLSIADLNFITLMVCPTLNRQLQNY